LKIIASRIGFAFMFDDSQECQEFFKTVGDKPDAKGFFFPLNSATDMAEIDKCRNMFMTGLKEIDDLVTVSGSKKNLEAVARVVEFVDQTKPDNFNEDDVKTATKVMKIICHK